MKKYIQINITEEVIKPSSMKIKQKKDVCTSYSTVTEVIESLRKRTKKSDKYLFFT